MRLQAKLLGLLLIAGIATAVAQSPRDQLRQWVEQLQKNPSDSALRARIIKLAQEIKPAPAIPEESRRFFVRGNALQKDAKNVDDARLAIGEYQKALETAPWWSDIYFNLSLAHELASDFSEAIRATRMYLLTDPKDAREAQDRVYALEARADQVSRMTAAKERTETLIVPRERIGPVFLGMTEAELIRALGNPARTETERASPGWRSFYWGRDLSADKGMVRGHDWNVSVTNGVVTNIFSSVAGLRTAEGVNVGMDAREVRSKLGVPAEDHGQSLCYPGLMVGFTGGKVHGFLVRKVPHTC